MPALTLPFKLPARYVSTSSSMVTSDLDTGGYDFLVGGQGFRFATDQNHPYVRETEPTTIHRFDTSLDPGEQSLSELPWIKSQESWHGGAGQLNLEHGSTAFQYQQEQIDHVRYDTSLGLDVWTVGTVSRLPDCAYYGLGAGTFDLMVTGTLAGIDYAIVGSKTYGMYPLYQLAWLSGPDVAPTITAVDMSSTAFNSPAITSLATDGTNYYAVVQQTTAGYVANVLTYIISGRLDSAVAPNVLYECPNTVTGATRTNLCSNPSVETDLAGWTAVGSIPPTVTRSATRAEVGTESALCTWPTAPHSTPPATQLPTFTTVSGSTYTASCWVYVPTGSPAVFLIAAGIAGGAASTVTNAWQRISITFAATSTTGTIQVWPTVDVTSGQQVWIDAALFELAPTVGTYFDGSTTHTSTYNYSWSGTTNDSTSIAAPITALMQAPSIVGWVKARLIGCISSALYELNPLAAAHSALPTANYTHPIHSAWTWTAVSESPTAILCSGVSGNQSSILSFPLDTAGGTPILTGGASIAVMPPGEEIYSLESYLGTFLAIGTSFGVRIGTFDTYSGTLTYGPLSITTTKPAYGLVGRDRFVYASFTDAQADGSTGIARLDLTLPVDSSNRLAWSPDLRPLSTAPKTNNTTVLALGGLGSKNRLAFLTPYGVHVEGGVPGTDGSAWLRTSRIRYDTAELKLFKRGRIHGSLHTAEIQITGLTPFGVGDTNLGTFGFLTGTDDPGEFGLPVGLYEWIQLEFALIGSTATLDSYQVKALPAPKRQHIIQVTGSCFSQEQDRYGLDVTDPQLPRDRYQSVLDIEAIGDEIRFVEFTNFGSVAENVVIDQIQYESYFRPSIQDDFGGYITFKLRSTA